MGVYVLACVFMLSMCLLNLEARNHARTCGGGSAVRGQIAFRHGQDGVALVTRRFRLGVRTIGVLYSSTFW